MATTRIAYGLLDFHEVCIGQPLKPVKLLLDSILYLQHVIRTTQLGVA